MAYLILIMIIYHNEPVQRKRFFLHPMPYFECKFSNDGVVYRLQHTSALTALVAPVGHHGLHICL